MTEKVQHCYLMGESPRTIHTNFLLYTLHSQTLSWRLKQLFLPAKQDYVYLLKEVWPEVCVFVYAHVYGKHTEIVNHFCVFNLLLMGILSFFLVIIHVLIVHV